MSRSNEYRNIINNPWGDKVVLRNYSRMSIGPILQDAVDYDSSVLSWNPACDVTVTLHGLRPCSLIEYAPPESVIMDGHVPGSYTIKADICAFRQLLHIVAIGRRIIREKMLPHSMFECHSWHLAQPKTAGTGRSSG